MKKFENKKNGRIAVLVSEDEKYKTVILEYEDDHTTINVTLPTLKRWWRKVAEDAVEEVAIVEPAEKTSTDISNAIVDDFEKQEDAEKELTDEQYAQIGREIAEDAKKKADEAKKRAEKKPVERKKSTIIPERKARVLESLNAHPAGLTVLTYEKMPNLILVKNGKKTVFEIRVTKTGLTYNVRVADVPGNLEFYTINNYYLPATIKVAGEAHLAKFIAMAEKVYGKEEK